MLDVLKSCFLIAFGVALGLFLLFLCEQARAQEAPGHSSHHSGFYDTLKMPNGASCCNDKDCRPVDGWTFDGKIYKIRLKPGGEWITPPQGLVQHKLTPDGGAHACFVDAKGAPFEQYGRVWYCIILPVTGF
jgi:hypothetical protein